MIDFICHFSDQAAGEPELLDLCQHLVGDFIRHSRQKAAGGLRVKQQLLLPERGVLEFHQVTEMVAVALAVRRDEEVLLDECPNPPEMRHRACMDDSSQRAADRLVRASVCCIRRVGRAALHAEHL